MRGRTWPLAAALAIAGSFIALGAPAPAPAAESPRVLMVDNEPDLTRWHYEPADITVPAGTTVVWFNKGKEEHSVTADDKSFDSGLKKSGATFSRAFAQPGKFTYYCAPHPWMKGSVQVIGARTASASASTSTTAAPPTTTTSTTAPAPPPVSATSPAPAPGAAAPAPGAESTPPAPDESEGDPEENALPASDREGSGDNLVGTLAVVLLPTLGALALGARLRQSTS